MLEEADLVHRPQQLELLGALLGAQLPWSRPLVHPCSLDSRNRFREPYQPCFLETFPVSCPQLYRDLRRKTSPTKRNPRPPRRSPRSRSSGSRPCRSACRSARVPRQPVPDDPPLDDGHPRPHRRRGSSARPTRATRTRGCSRSTRIIHDEIAPRLVGEDAFAIERCWELTRPATFDILRDRRLGLVACACVDTALWDAVGKALGQPLWRLWGGYRGRLPMISIGGYYDSPVAIAEEIAELRELRPRRDEVQGRRAAPEEDAARSASRARPAGRTSSSPPTPTRAGRPSEAIAFATARRGLRPALVRGAVPLAQRPPRDARRALLARRARVRRARASSRPPAAAT